MVYGLSVPKKRNNLSITFFSKKYLKHNDYKEKTVNEIDYKELKDAIELDVKIVYFHFMEL